MSDTTPEQEKALLDEYFGAEDLDPELVPYLHESGDFGWANLKHPLVFSICHTPLSNKQCNRQLAYKKGAVREALREGQWHTYVFLHERPYRVEAFKRIAKRLADNEYWKLLAECWIDSENIRQNPDIWYRLLRSRRPGRENMMQDYERVALENMPDTLEVFQGHTDERDDGWSWTLDRSKAEWFARRFADMERCSPAMSFGTCLRRDVIAFLDRRGESEILIPIRKVDIHGVSPVKRLTTRSSGDGAHVTMHQSVADAFLYVNSTGNTTTFLETDL